jgi:DGQHR domain-containing protein
MVAEAIQLAPRPSEAGATSGIQTWVVDNKVAFAVMRPEELRTLLFVSTYSSADPHSPAPQQHGYQRDPMETRFPPIGRYYYSHADLVTPLIISVRLRDPGDIGEFEILFGNGEFIRIKERWDESTASTVDGQHRAGGLVWAHHHLHELLTGEDNENEFDPPVPVMLYFGLSYEEEAELFDTINSTQRKLPKALIEVTKGDITERGEQSHAQAIREIAFALARDTDSVWCGIVNMTGARDPDKKVTYEGLRRSTSNMFPAELIGRIDARGESPVSYAKTYWQMVAEVCSVAWDEHPAVSVDENGDAQEKPVQYRLKELVGVASVARLGKDIVTSALEVAQYRKTDDTMVDYVSKLFEVDWRKHEQNPWVATQAGFSGQRDLYTMLYNLVYNDIRPGADAEAEAQ